MINSKGIATVFIKRAHSDSYFYKFLFWKRHSRDQSPIFFVVVALRRLQLLENRRENRRPQLARPSLCLFPGYPGTVGPDFGVRPREGIAAAADSGGKHFYFPHPVADGRRKPAGRQGLFGGPVADQGGAAANIFLFAGGWKATGVESRRGRERAREHPRLVSVGHRILYV